MKEEVEKEKVCWRVGLKVAWDIHTPGLALPLQSGDCYYMTGTQSHSSVSRNSRLKYMCKEDCTVSVTLICIRPGIIFPRGCAHQHPFIYKCVSVSLGFCFHMFLLSSVSESLRKPNAILWIAVTPVWEQYWDRDRICKSRLLLLMATTDAPVYDPTFAQTLSKYPIKCVWWPWLGHYLFPDFCVQAWLMHPLHCTHFIIPVWTFSSIWKGFPVVVPLCCWLP